jgi:hypothetical protein
MVLLHVNCSMLAVIAQELRTLFGTLEPDVELLPARCELQGGNGCFEREILTLATDVSEVF